MDKRFCLFHSPLSNHLLIISKMDLGNIFKSQEKKGPEFFWSLVITKGWVEAGIWRVVGDKTKVVAEGSGSSWQEDNEETLVQAADSALSAAAASFEEEGEEPNKVVFGLSSSWVEDGNIKSERLGLLKKVSEELELKPAGFVAIPEALVHFLKSREGAPPNAILVGLLEDAIELSLVGNGKVTGTVEVARSMSLGADVAEGLARFSSTKYPSRIILYNHRVADLEEATQALIDTEWAQLKIGFLHTPKVETLEENALVAAVSLAGGAEVGQAKIVEFAQDMVPAPEEAKEEEVEAQKGEVEEAAEAEEEPELKEVSAEELGFIKGDVAEQAKESPQPQERVVPPEQQAQPAKRRLPEFKLPSLPSFRLPSFSLRPSGSLVGLVIFLLVAALITTSLAYWYLPRAEVTIYVAPKTLEKTLSVEVDPDAQVLNQEKGIIPGKIASAQVSGEKTKSTTGTKIVGDRARGEVTIFRVGPAITLGQGTILTSPNNLEFTLDEETKVASGSAGSAGTVKASVTASSIGAEYNLAQATTFVVANFSTNDIEAKNENAFSGGSSREVAAVSANDRADLEKELASELVNQGLGKIKADLSQEEVLLEGSESLEVTNRDFSHAKGDEAATLKLAMQARVDSLIAPRDALTSYLQTALGRDVPEGFSMRPEQIKTEFSKLDDEEGKFNLKVIANLLPQVNPSEVAKNIAGKYPTTARESLSIIPGFTRAEIAISIKFPGRLGTLPRLARNIVIKVEAER